VPSITVLFGFASMFKDIERPYGSDRVRKR
jgi:hypothetical protein